MELIKKRLNKNTIKINVSGRLDAYWSGYLEKELEEVMHSGVYNIRLNLKKTDYISSAGIRILLKYTKKFKTVNGSFVITSLSKGAELTLELAGLMTVLTISGDEEINLEEEEKADDYSIKFTEENQTEKLQLELIGEAGLPLSDKWARENYEFNSETLGLGIGELSAPGSPAANKPGEFLSLYGAAAYLSTDGENKPDYIIESNNLIPNVNIVYGAAVKGNLQKRFEFSAAAESIKLSEIADICRENSKTDQTAVLIIAETSGLVGASLRAKTGAGAFGGFFKFPDIREKINFSSEPVFAKYLTLSAGIIASEKASEWLKKFLRPLTPESGILCHIHSLAFQYIPLTSDVCYKSKIKNIFSARAPEGLLHLFTDARPITGAGESGFTRGEVYFGDIEGGRK